MSRKNTKSKEALKLPEVVTTKLKKAETKRLKELEEIIDDNIKGVFKVGSALREIREKRLYRDLYDNFDEYCYDKWDFGRRYAEFQIQAVSVIENIEHHEKVIYPKKYRTFLSYLWFLGPFFQ